MAALLVVGVPAVSVIARAGDDETIADGVRIGTLDVGGIDRGEAGALVRRKLAGARHRPPRTAASGCRCRR